MLELAASGAKILLHCAASSTPAAINMPIHVRSSFSYREGTWVIPNLYEGDDVEAPIIAGVAHDRSEAKITVVGVPDQPGQGGRDLPGLSPTPRSTST